MCFIHYIFSTNPLDITLFCHSSCWYLFDSVSPHLTHMFSVIKFFQFLGTWCGGRGCIGFENLEASLCCIRLLVSVYFSQDSCTHTQTHRITKSFSVLPAKLVSSFIPGCTCLWVKYLWKIAMIGFIMLPAVSKDGNEFGILGLKKNSSSPFQNISLLDSRKWFCLPVMVRLCTAWWGAMNKFSYDPEITMSSVLIVSVYYELQYEYLLVSLIIIWINLQ